jgi:predicted nucleic acid-binding protein
MPDTSCILPVLVVAHDHAVRARDEINRRLAAGETMILAAHSLLETYANLTSAPRPSRLSGRRAVETIQAFVARANAVVALDAPGYGALLPALAVADVVGGAVYDGLIYQTARSAGVDVLLTFNERDFGRLETDVRVVVP